MNLYNLIFRMVILIPFLTQPPHECTLTGRGSPVYPKGRGSRVYPKGRGSRVYPKGRDSRVYPNVGAAGCGLVGAGGVLGLRPRGLLYEFVLYNLYKNVRIGIKIT